MPKFNNNKKRIVINWSDSKPVPNEDPYNYEEHQNKIKNQKNTSNKKQMNEYSKQFAHLKEYNKSIYNETRNARNVFRKSTLKFDTSKENNNSSAILSVLNNLTEAYHKCDSKTTSNKDLKCTKCNNTYNKKQAINELMDKSVKVIKSLKDEHDKSNDSNNAKFIFGKMVDQKNNLLEELKPLDNKLYSFIKESDSLNFDKWLDKWKDKHNYCPLNIKKLNIEDMKLSLNFKPKMIKKIDELNDVKFELVFVKIANEYINEFNNEFTKCDDENKKYINKTSGNNDNKFKFLDIEEEKMEILKNDKFSGNKMHVKNDKLNNQNQYKMLSVYENYKKIEKSWPNNTIDKNDVLDIKYNFTTIIYHESLLKLNEPVNLNIESDLPSINLGSNESLVCFIKFVGNENVKIDKMDIKFKALSNYDCTFRPDMNII